MPKDKKIEKTSQEASEQVKQKTIKEGLSEIYQDDDGEIIDVKKLNIKPKKKWWFWPGMVLLYATIIGVVGFGIWYFLNSTTDAEAVEFSIESEKKVVSGEEFYYTIKYNNLERVGINDILIRLEYPSNFIFLDSSPMPSQDNNIWRIDSLGAHRGGEIKIKGKLVSIKDKQNIILGEMIYMPENFTSEFKKTTSFDNVIVDSGLDLEVISPASALVNEEQKIIVKYKAKNEGYLDNFRLTVEPTDIENVKLLAQPQDSDKIIQLEPWVWQVQGIDKKEEALKIRFKFLDKVTASQSFKFKFEYEYDPNLYITIAETEEETATKTEQENIDETEVVKEGELVANDLTKATEELVGVSYYLFWQETVNIQVVKNNLNLNLIINGSDQDQSIDFGQTLNYSINYYNKEDYDMEDVMIMAVLEGDLLDWSSLSGEHNGVVQDNTITWTKSQLPDLALVASDDEGVIDFSINIKTSDKAKKDTDYKGNSEIKSYIQFRTLLDKEEQTTSTDDQINMSNIVINKVNSDLQLVEEVRYFNDDNIAVGNGPVPPKVGETTSLRVYWQIDNSLHALNNVQVVSELPAYVVWANKDQSNIGNLRYESGPHRVVWEIDHLPIHAQQPIAEFNISITPIQANLNQIMILLQGSRIVANDSITDDEITQINKVKTTKLEDDVMIDNSGVVQ